MIINKTRKGLVSKQEKYYRDVFSQARGLMFSKRKNLVMVLDGEKKVSLHNWFVFYPIDVLVLDSDKRIVEIKRDFKPFSFWSSEKKGKYGVELGFKGNYRVGDKLELRKV